MDVPRVLVISEQQLVSQGLKLIIENAGSGEVVTAPNEATAAIMMADVNPRIVVFDRDAIDEAQDKFKSEEDYPDRIVIIDSSHEKMVVYARSKVDAATLENLLGNIRGNQE